MIETLQPKTPIVWSISASVSGGGNGIQADLLTFNDFNVHGCTVVTAINAQNSFTQGYSVATERKSVVAQINALDSDLQARAIKVGVLPNAEIIESVTKYLSEYAGFVIYDPELDCNGESIIASSLDLLLDKLFPRLDLLIVNVEEANAILDGRSKSIKSPKTMEAAANTLITMGPKAVLITGASFSDSDGKRFDYCRTQGASLWITIDALDTAHNRGGGCILSAAIAAAVAGGETLQSALLLGKAYVTQGIRGAISMGGGPGAVAHLGWPNDENDKPSVSENPPSAGV